MRPVLLHVLLGQAEINQEDLVHSFASADQEIIRLDVSMEELPGMDVLNGGEHLGGEHEGGLESEFAVGHVEEVFQGRAHEVHDHDVVVTLVGTEVDLGDTLV